ncbi:AI-2E family transporter [Luteimicrobium subarcticum]|uniref:Putative PurR-regulated permease PerM n=1 Tax=Luteimicrobium subarcticum TaxID=620910 RepID=A0A2M8W1J7_9MICO|nr:AI-2E family transporter [Luteimicrobium subarcticum]PJI84803.1 putative PurR-regulated permease PerM [Luteimicrobium subarcticum]
MPTRTGLAPSTRTLLSLAAAIVVLAGVHEARGVLAPLFLAAVLVIIAHPVRKPLVRRGWPGWLATSVVVAIVYAILAALAAMLTFAGVKFGELVQQYLSDLQSTANDVVARLNDLGLQTSGSDAVTQWLEPSKLLSLATSISGTLVGIASTLFVICAYAIFMAADGARYEQARDLFGDTRGPIIDRTEAFNGGVRRYFVVSATFGGIVAIIDGLALWALGVPAPAVWAILAFVTNFIPNIGFVLGLIPPAVLALVVGGWPLMLVVIGVYCVVNVVLQVLVQPKFVADAVNISLTLSFVSVLFWTFIIGPLGAILAIPLTLLLRAFVLEGDPDTRWLRWLSGDTEAAPRPAVPAAKDADDDEADAPQPA